MRKEETIRTEEYTYTAVFKPSEDGGFVVSVPALAGCVTEGETFEDAREMVIDAIRGYLESLQKDGLPIPVEQFADEAEPVREKVRVQLKTV